MPGKDRNDALCDATGDAIIIACCIIVLKKFFVSRAKSTVASSLASHTSAVGFYFDKFRNRYGKNLFLLS